MTNYLFLKQKLQLNRIKPKGPIIHCKITMKKLAFPILQSRPRVLSLQSSVECIFFSNKRDPPTHSLRAVIGIASHTKIKSQC